MNNGKISTTPSTLPLRNSRDGITSTIFVRFCMGVTNVGIRPGKKCRFTRHFWVKLPFGEKLFALTRYLVSKEFRVRFGFFFFLIFSFHLLIHSFLLFSLFNWPHLKRLIQTNYRSFSFGYDGRKKQTKGMASEIWKWRVQFLISSPFGALILKTVYRPGRDTTKMNRLDCWAMFKPPLPPSPPT